MESLPNSPLLEFPPNTIYEVRKTYGLEKPGDMSEAVNILHKWVQMQNHFVTKDFTKGYLEHTIIMCKGSIEKAKRQIDKLCTFKTHLPKFFAYTNIKEELREFSEKAFFFILPKMTPDYCRTVIFRLKNANIKPNVMSQFYYYIIIACEYVKANDYSLSYTLVFDHFLVNTQDVISKLDLIELQQCIPILIEGYGTRVKAIVFLTKSTFVHVFIKILKTFLSEKISNRIHVFNDAESFHSLIPKELLPVEYGGSERSVERLHDETIEMLSSKEHVEYMKKMQQAKTDETKRTVDVFNDQYLGMAGTFRTLHVD